MHTSYKVADHLAARGRAARGREEDERAPATPPARADRSGGEGPARGAGIARGAALLRAWFG